jgi:CHAT domain-containing protein
VNPDALAALATQSWAELIEERANIAERMQTLSATPGHTFTSMADLFEAGLTLEVQTWVALLEVWIPLARADAADALGSTDVADQWYDAALAAAHLPSVPPNELVNVLISNGRIDLARTALSAAASSWTEGDTALAFRALECGDVRLAGEAFAHSGVDPLATPDLGYVLVGAQIALVSGDPVHALDVARRGIEVFEDRLSRIVRDIDRLAACDDSSIAGLYLSAAQASVRLAEGPSHRRDFDLLGPAFAFTERARTLALANLIDPEDELPEALRQEWRWTAAEWSVTVDRLVGAIDTTPPVDTAPMLERFEVAEHRLRDVEIAIDAARPGTLLQRARPRPPLPLAMVQERLPDDTLLLEYHLLRDDLMVWAVANDAVEVHQRSVPARGFRAIARKYGRRCAHGSGQGPERSELQRWLLDPVVDMVTDHTRVIIVPFGLLNGVAFHTLPVRDVALGLSHVVSYAPAASVALRDSVDDKFTFEHCAIVGDPEFDAEFRPGLSRLPGAKIEARTIARLLSSDDVFTGSEATEDTVRRVLSDRTVVHLATHGWLDELAPHASSLVMAGRDELTVAELVQLQMRAQLVVLSACDTGRGAATLGGDVVGLTRSLLASGVHRAVVSLWPVDDASACVTMVCFYERLIAGDAPAAALASAQRTVHGLDSAALRARYTELAGDTPLYSVEHRRGERELNNGSGYDDAVAPLGGDAECHWAPFVLIGV